MTDDFKWMRESLTNSQKTQLDKTIKKLQSRRNKQFHGVIGTFLMIDEALLKVATKSKIKWPKWTPKYPLGDHPRPINPNLFIFYPYSFDSEQFVEIVKEANEDGFKVRVDAISSRVPAGNVRVIFWKPRKKNLEPE